MGGDGTGLFHTRVKHPMGCSYKKRENRKKGEKRRQSFGESLNVPGEKRKRKEMEEGTSSYFTLAAPHHPIAAAATTASQQTGKARLPYFVGFPYKVLPLLAPRTALACTSLHQLPQTRAENHHYNHILVPCLSAMGQAVEDAG